MADPKVLVLGATGFIGGQVAKACAGRGWRVRGLRRHVGAVGDLVATPIEWIDGDLSSREQMTIALDGVDTVFHVAGYYPKGTARVAEHIRRGLHETRAVLGAVQQAGVTRFIYTSSLSTIGWPSPPGSRPVDESDHYLPGSLPASGYYEAKAAMEQEVLKASRDGLPAVIVNPTAVFGPGDVHLTTARLLILAAKGVMRVSVPATINVVDVRDVAQAHIRVAEAGTVGERYILGGTNLSLRQFLTLAANIAGAPGPSLEIPLSWLESMVRLFGWFPPLASAAGHLRALRLWPAYDNRKARRELGLQPRPIEDTLHDAYRWLAETRHVKLRRTMV
jgi:dihydroflavonol-4-reductase